MWKFSHHLLRCRSHMLHCRNSDAIHTPAHVTRGNKNDSSISISKLFQPATIKNIDANNIGAELTGKMNKSELLKVLNKFIKQKEIFNLCTEYGLDGVYFVQCSMRYD